MSETDRTELKLAHQTMRQHCTGARIATVSLNPHRDAAKLIHKLTGKPAKIHRHCTCVARQGLGDR